MDHHERALRRPYWVVAGLIVWFALGLQLYLIIAANIENNTSVALGIIKFFSYFTILSNLFVASAFTVPLRAPLSRLGTFLSRSSVRAAIAAYILVTGIVYVLVLRKIWDPQGLQLVADIILHYATPLLYLVSWLFLERRGHLKLANVSRWLLFPLGYFGYCIARGALSGIYPYPFIDVTQLGLFQVVLNALGLTSFFIALGFFLVMVDRLLGLWSEQTKKHLKRINNNY